ncbi:MAG: EVE domain-containing protein [Cyclobacteriaceae bacterium]|nr:EVE domain-containing protein [Cyclobacteriaceae bacterium]
MKYWLVKTEPETYGWIDFEGKGPQIWEGVRNYQARNHLKEMKTGDEVLFYHSGKNAEVVGIANVVKEYYPDPSADKGDWVAVDLQSVRLLKRPVSLAEIKKDDRFQDTMLVRNSRLSVAPLTNEQYYWILEKENS